MEKRIGIIGIIIEDFSKIEKVTDILHQFQDFILGRQGMNLKDHNIRIISLIMEATTDQFGSLTGKLGKISGIRVKSILSKNQEDRNDNKSDDS